MKDTVKVRPLRPYEKIKLHPLKKLRRNTVNSRNARIILIAVNHPPNRRIAEMAVCSVQWVRQIIHRFNDHGIDGITWYASVADTHRRQRISAAEVISSPSFPNSVSRLVRVGERDILSQHR
ncbi:MAG TPA: hypothetical protein VFE62_29495 [Gemmataceae bacterium]|nr:hypothetical protein [Gemmataceae bacterium]